MASFHVTAFGKAVARTGLQPGTIDFLLRYLATHATDFHARLPTTDQPGELDSVFFAIAHACFRSPEFGNQGYQSTRALPYQLGELITNEMAEQYESLLVEQPWYVSPSAANTAMLVLKWINGASPRELEKSKLAVGRLRETCRNLIWILSSVADVLSECVAPRVPDVARPLYLRGNPGLLDALRPFPRLLRRLVWRVSEGLPEDVLWMSRIVPSNNQSKLARSEILTLRTSGMITPLQAMEGSPTSDAIRRGAFSAGRPTPTARANWFRDAVRDWKKQQRTAAAERQRRRAEKCKDSALVDQYYAARGKDFEQIFEKILDTLTISYERLDTKDKQGAPDYLIKLGDLPAFVFELKSKEAENLVPLNDATEVLTASELHGYRDNFCVTVCHPGVDPSVPNAIAACGRLAVVESSDLGEALLRLCEGFLDFNQLHEWLTTPGQAVSDDLPFRG